MAVQMDIQIAEDLSDSTEEPPPSSQLINWAQAAWQGNVVDEPVISLRIVSPAESQQLNNDYRGKNKPTNVLSFPMQMDDVFTQLQDMLDDEQEDENLTPESILGDLVICADVVAQEAHLQAKSSDAHWAHMVVHGMLHLQGYDHIEDEDAQQMEQLETQIMQSLGFVDPYQIKSSEIISSSSNESPVAEPKS